MEKPSVKDWIGAMRFRTLPLAIACILMGSFLAWFYEAFNGWVLIFSLLTTLSLQILSNLANDYGDSKHGADHEGRKGPSRAVQSGRISGLSMKNAIIVFVIIAIIFGNLLLVFSEISWLIKLVFLMLGLLAILAAIKYTMGKKPYGYRGLGDISVFIFFGIVAVIGTYFLHTTQFRWDILLPAATTGFFAVAVLNINNIRDIESDIKAGKMSLAVKWGRRNAVIYHIMLLSLALIFSIVFVKLNYRGLSQYLFIVSIPMFIRNAIAVAQIKEQSALDPYLKQMAMSTLIFVLLFGIGHALALS